MARKNLLQGLIGDQKAGAPVAPPADPVRPRHVKGAIGAVGQSIADLKARAISELDPFCIDPGGLPDRLEEDAADHDALVASIRAHGQQVPVLVRPHPQEQGRYQIVYGRRRVRALRQLGQKVKAMVRDLDDQALVLAQGQENAARKDLTFIEKANFARQMRDAGYDRKTICAALHVDKTRISRMLSVADAISPALIAAIGAAPSVGRNRWRQLADRMTQGGVDLQMALDLIGRAEGAGSDGRFEALMQALSSRQRPATGNRRGDPGETVLRGHAGAEIGRLAQDGRNVTLTIPREQADGFGEWLAERLTDMHREWLEGRSPRGS